MRIVITGATGFIGRQLVAMLARDESLPGAPHQLVCLTRNPQRAKAALPGPEWVQWDPTAHPEAMVSADVLDSASAVVHLAGETAVGRRLTDSVKRQIKESRINTTRGLVKAMEGAPNRPGVFVCASAVGYYGPRPAHEEVDEQAGPGSDFLADVTRLWEAEAEKAEPLGVRTARMRFGIVLGAGGGALQAMATPVRFFVGGKLGSGAQPVPWVHVEDVARALCFVIAREDLQGAFNVAAPVATSNQELTKKIGEVLSRPTPFAVPAFALKAVLGEGADPLLSGQRAVPRRLGEAGFSFAIQDLDEAVRSSLAHPAAGGSPAEG